MEVASSRSTAQSEKGSERPEATGCQENEEGGSGREDPVHVGAGAPCQVGGSGRKRQEGHVAYVVATTRESADYDSEATASTEPASVRCSPDPSLTRVVSRACNGMSTQGCHLTRHEAPTK